ELLCGCRPYRPKHDSLGSLEDAIVTTQPVPPSSAASVPAHRRALAGDIDTIVLKALKKAPADRYATANELLDDLDRHLGGLPVRARADSFWYRTRKFVHRNRFAVSAAGATALALLTLSTVATWQMVEAQRQRQAAEQENDRAASTRNFLNFVLSQTGASDRPFTTGELLAEAEKSIAGHFGSLDDPRAIEELSQLSELYQSIGQSGKALELAEVA